MDLTEEDYTNLLSALLPPGPAWSVDDPGIAGAAPSLLRVHQRGNDLMLELDPRTTTELIDRWELCCGLPDECIPSGTQTLQQRQQRLDAKVNLAGGINEAFYLAQLAALGKPDATITRYDKSPFKCISDCNEQVFSIDWRYYWEVNMPSSTDATSMTCISTCDSSLRIWGDTVVSACSASFVLPIPISSSNIRNPEKKWHIVLIQLLRRKINSARERMVLPVVIHKPVSRQRHWMMIILT